MIYYKHQNTIPLVYSGRRHWAAEHLDAARCYFQASQRLRILARVEENELVADVLWTKAFDLLEKAKWAARDMRCAVKSGDLDGPKINPYRR